MAPHADARRFCVLVVDDNRTAADALARLLRTNGFDARAADDGEAALAAVRHWQPDAAILEVLLSGLDGVALAGRMREEAARPMLLVALTGLGTIDELAPVKAGAFDHVFLKPVEPDELLGLLDARLRGTDKDIRGSLRSSVAKPSPASSAPNADAPVFGSAPSGVACRKRRAAYAVIIGGDGRVVCVSRPRGFWLPGGGMLPGERPEDAVRREVREELGRVVRLTSRIGKAIQYFDSPADACWYEMTAYFFTAEFDGEPHGAGDEATCRLDADDDRGSFFHACHAWAVACARTNGT